MNGKIFFRFLSDQRHRKDDVGWFATFAIADRAFPDGELATRQSTAAYLVRSGAQPRMLKAFHQAWSECEAIHPINEAVSAIRSRLA